MTILEITVLSLLGFVVGVFVIIIALISSACKKFNKLIDNLKNNR